MGFNAYRSLLPDPRDLALCEEWRGSDALLGGDGYDFVDRVGLRPPGWKVVASWGCNGWDLGSWPLITVAHYDDGDVFAIAVRVEGDLTVRRYPSREVLYAATDREAEFHWRNGQSIGPSDVGEYPQGQLPLEYRGPYRRSRHAS